MKLYTYYRRIIVAVFAHLSQEFRSGLKADLDRARNVADKEASDKAEAIEQALEQAFTKEIQRIECNMRIDRLERLESLQTDKEALEIRLTQFEKHLESLDGCKFGPRATTGINYSRKSVNKVVCKG
jgi:hypothetical protein